MTLFELYGNLTNQEIIEKLKTWDLLISSVSCEGTEKKPHKMREMKLVKRKNRDELSWRCNICGTWKGIRNGSFFDKNRLSISELFKLMLHWVMQTKISNLKNEFKCSRQCVYEFYQRLQLAILRDYSKSPIILGGPGINIEVCESLSINDEQIRVLGLRERASGRCYFEIIVPSEDNEDNMHVLDIIIKHCQSGSMIICEKWNEYQEIINREIRQESNSCILHFVAPESTVQVQPENDMIQRDWNLCKSRFKMMRSCSRQNLQAYIDEFCWRRNVELSLDGDRHVAVFEALLNTIKTYFPLNGITEKQSADSFSKFYYFISNDQFMDEDDEFDIDYDDDIQDLSHKSQEPINGANTVDRENLNQFLKSKRRKISPHD